MTTMFVEQPLAVSLLNRQSPGPLEFDTEFLGPVDQD